MTAADHSAPLPGQLVIGSRASELALWQTRHVIEQLQALYPGIACSICEVATKGDQVLDRPLPTLGGQGVFAAELDQALLQGEIDMAVHSLKDLPTQSHPEIEVIPILPREDPRDVLISPGGLTLDQLPRGSVVGTSSLRRQSQLLSYRSDLKIASIRGNVPTRIAKAEQGDYAAVILAAAGVRRIDRSDAITEWLDLECMLPAPGQAALAATCRRSDPSVARAISGLVHRPTSDCVLAERHFLSSLGGGCSAPIAAYAHPVAAGSAHPVAAGSATQDVSTDATRIELTGRLAAVDGSTMITRRAIGDDPRETAEQLADEVLRAGGDQIVATWRSSYS